MVNTLTTNFSFGDRVHIDDDDSIAATVTGFCWRTHRSEVEVKWFNNGEECATWVSEWRLSLATKG